MKTIKDFLKSLGIIIIYIVLITATELLNEGMFNSYGLIIKNIVLTLGTFITALIIAYLLKEKLKGQFDDFKKNYKNYIPFALKTWLIGLCVMVISNLIITFLAGGIAPNEEANRELIKNYPFYSITSVCLLAPFTEELLFRLNFKNVIKRRLPFILFTGVFFGFVHILASEHLIELLYIIPYSALGIAFAKTYYDTNNIYSSVFAHAFHNTLTILIILGSL